MKPYLSACRTETVLVCADAVPAETADLVTTGAGKEVDIINLQWFHAEGALHGVVLHLRATRHPMTQYGGRWRLHTAPDELVSRLERERKCFTCRTLPENTRIL